MTATPLLQPGSYAGKYRLVERLGSGGSAQVWLATYSEAHGVPRRVALKLVEGGGGPDRFRRVVEEARRAGRIHHPNVVDVYEVGAFGSQLFVAMEFVRGRSLARLLAALAERGLRLPRAVLLDVGLQLARGLAAVHRAGLVHLDVKPQNLVVGQSGIVKLVDFGVARAEGQDASPGMAGTPSYMAPEQWSGGTLGPSTDIFSFGILLAEMATGQRLYHANAPWESFRRQRDSTPQADVAGVSEVFPELTSLVLRCLARDPRERMLSALQIEDELLILRARLGLSGDLSVLQRVLRSWEEGEPATAGLLGPEWEALAGLRGTGVGGGNETLTFHPTGTREGHNSNIVAPDNRFVGRREELAWLMATHRAHRLLTVVGPGGAGKSRLCQRFGRMILPEYQSGGGVWTVDLGSTAELAGLLTGLGTVLGVPFQQNETAPARITRLGHALSARGPTLLLLDNAEQLAEPCGTLIEACAELAPETRFLVSSRVRLRLPEEQALTLGPLAASEAVELFSLRAEAARGQTGATPEQLSRLVERLDGLPLAIELAAARSRHFTPAAMLGLLDRRFELLRQRTPGRHQTLHSVLEWSVQQLEEPEQVALRRASSFAGSFDLAAFQHLVGCDLFEAAELIEVLCEGFLVRQDAAAGRYRLPESVRDFAARRARPDERRAAERVHAAWYLHLAEDLAPAVRHQGARAARDQLAAERENLLAVQARFRQQEPSLSLRAALALDPLLGQMGPLELRLRLLREAETQLHAVPPAVRVEVLVALSHALRHHNDPTAGQEAAHRALELAEELADDALAGTARLSLGALAWQRHDLSSATTELQQALALAHGDPVLAAQAGANLGMVLRSSGRAEQAEETLLEALQLCARAQLVPLEAGILDLLSTLRLNQLRLEDARSYAERALDRHRRRGDVRREAITLTNLATIEWQLGQLSAAARRSVRAASLHRRVGNLRHHAVVLGNLGLIRLEEGAESQAERLLIQARQMHRELGDTHHQLVNGFNLALVRRYQGRLVDARRELEALHSLAHGHGNRRLTGYIECSLAATEADLGRVDASRAALERARASLAEARDPLSSELLAFAQAHLALALAREADSRDGRERHLRQVRAQLAASIGKQLGNDGRIAQRLLQRAMRRTLDARGTLDSYTSLEAVDSDPEGGNETLDSGGFAAAVRSLEDFTDGA